MNPPARAHWFEPLAEFMGPAYLRYSFTKGTEQEVGFLVDALGLETAQGLTLSESFYWDLDDATRAWSKRFFDIVGKMPNSLQAGVYSSVTHYLKAVKAAGTTDAAAAREEMEQAYPGRRIAHPREVAAAVVFLLSGGASFVNGAPLLVDGGLTAKTY